MFSPPFSKIVAALCDGDDDARHVVVIVFSLFKYPISSGYRKIPTEVLRCKTSFPLDLNFFRLEYNFSLLQNLEDSQDTEDFWMWWEEEDEEEDEETDDDGRKAANVLLQEARRLAMTDDDKKICKQGLEGEEEDAGQHSRLWQRREMGNRKWESEKGTRACVCVHRRQLLQSGD